LDAASFDVVIGRYVLIFQDDVTFIRATARLVKPGGIVAFHEIDDADDFAALPEVPLWKQVNDWLMSALRSFFRAILRCFYWFATPEENASVGITLL
jgi:2-polyprenyl-3-methyl-5-hydroxy-6-metoxy-1,4-benzoquinol methylase